LGFWAFPEWAQTAGESAAGAGVPPWEMAVAATKYQRLVIFGPVNGKRWMTLAPSEVDEISHQFRFAQRWSRADGVVIDESGMCSEVRRLRITGLALETYLAAAGRGVGLVMLIIFSPILLLWGVLTLSFQVRAEMEVKVKGRQLSLEHVREMICDAVQSNPSFYPHAPVDEICTRVRTAKSISSCIAAAWVE
jgi:hypothetical protein